MTHIVLAGDGGGLNLAPRRQRPHKPHEWTASSLLWEFGDVREGRETMHVAKVAVINRKWVLDCLEQKRLLEVTPGYVVW